MSDLDERGFYVQQNSFFIKKFKTLDAPLLLQLLLSLIHRSTQTCEAISQALQVCVREPTAGRLTSLLVPVETVVMATPTQLLHLS